MWTRRTKLRPTLDFPVKYGRVKEPGSEKDEARKSNLLVEIKHSEFHLLSLPGSPRYPYIASAQILDQR